MKIKMAMVVVLLALLTSTVFAVGNIGPTTAGLKKGQWSIGADYAYSDIDLDTSSMKWKDPEGSGKMPFTFEDVKTNFYYATLGYGLTDNLEVFGRLGIADIKGEGIWPAFSSEMGLNFDNDIVWGYGIRYTFHQKEKVSWGVTAQMNWIDTSLGFRDDVVEEGDTIDLSGYDLLVSVGPTIDMRGWTLYGGPFFYMVNEDFDVDDHDLGAGTLWEGSADVEEDGSFGGHIGAAIPLGKNTDMTFEVASISGGWSAGTGLTIKF